MEKGQGAWPGGAWPQWGVARDSRALPPIDIVVERVVAPESDQGSQAQPVGEEYLGSRIQPHLEVELSKKRPKL